MNKKHTSLLLIALTMLFSGAAMADSHEEGEAAAEEMAGPTFFPLEIYGCNYNKGMDRGDLDKVIAGWNAWMDETKAEPYSAWVYTAFYGSPEYSFDVAWLGAWPNGNVMGRSADSWAADGGEHQAGFDKVLTCGLHANMAATQMRKTDRQPGDTAVLSFADCSVEEGSTMQESMQSIGEWNAYQEAEGSVGNEWIFFPVWGGDADFDFKIVSAHPNWTEVGADYERYANGGGYQKARELMGDKIDCGQSRMYNAERVRNGTPAAEN